MPTSISIGFSQHADPSTAVLEACVQVKNELNTNDTDMLVVFATPEYIVPETQSVISRTLKPKHLIGSSTRGIILSNGVADHGIAVMGIYSDELSFGVSTVNNLKSQNIRDVASDLARKASQNLTMARRDIFAKLYRKDLFLTFASGIENHASSFIHGIKEVLGVNFPVLGAISSDGLKHKGQSQFFQDQILKDAAVGVLMGGAELAMGCAHSFKPLGKPRTVTKVNGPVLHTIDNQPAVEIYKHFLGTKAQNPKDILALTATYPLGFYLKASHPYLLRNVIDILPDGSMVFHEGIPQGTEVHLMISSQDFLLRSAIQAAELVKDLLADKPAKMLFIFESTARHELLGRNSLREIRAIKDILGPAVPLIGLSSGAEIGPFDMLGDIKNVYLHNESIMIMAIS
jgi:hypothetical protein